ncbi:lipid kinase, YegS/Rv2252/BmrU family [Methylomagnum ishizawai]|uniref:Lipid kinase, YegS/Rv2252/BmrU family n=1 Tax=Methylomagnum ishizawai TaxID=1760988 RepID=A0A1Y6D227_9GAMM|nr:YegS/Rv2252/BmrU family lipid kinase [Methylomagnum ishizawai]SMF96636.1 lipid kinase, YegS/Rv2252/BmrU family [Methylomagnum ishizawai]
MPIPAPESNPPNPAPARIRAILNPAAGTRQDVRDALEQAFAARPDLRWEILETQAGDDARRFAAEAAALGHDLVIACGGDGTVMEVAAGLKDSPAALAIIPCGTANVLAKELGLPDTVEAALALALDPAAAIRSVDMGCVDGRLFLLRAGIGYEALYNLETSREEKTRLGRWAYLLAARRALARLREARYVITANGETRAIRGITCMICNSAGVGIASLRMAGCANVGDGLLDVIVLRSFEMTQIARFLASLVHSLLPFLRHNPPPLEDYWQAQTITVECSRRQWMTLDGEPFKQAKHFTASVVPQAVRVRVPRAEPVP